MPTPPFLSHPAQGPAELAAMAMAFPALDTTASLPLRRFSTWEICRYLIPLAPAHLRRVLRERPELPQGRSEGEDAQARWFTLEEVFRLRRFFAGNPGRRKRYEPLRPAGPRGRVLAVAQVGRGMGRTTTVQHLAAAAAMEGYQVLAVDLDPDAALTRRLVGTTTRTAAGIVPMVARHCGTQLRQENRRRLDRGEAPLPMDRVMDEAMDRSAGDVIAATRWPGVALLEAGSDLYGMAWQVPLWQAQVPGWAAWGALRDRFAAEGLLARYDIVLVDTGPDMGPLTLAALAAADQVLVPLSADDAGRASAMATLEQMAEVFRGIEERETLAARALGRKSVPLSWQSVRLVLNRYDPKTQAEAAARLQAALGSALLPQRQEISPLIGTGVGQVSCIYEADYRDSNRERFAAARASFDALYATVREQVLAAWRAEAEEAG